MVDALLDQPFPAAHECAALTQFLGRNVTLCDHAGSAKLREQLRIEPVVFHLSNPDSLGLSGIGNNHVETLVERVVNRVVVTGCFNRRLAPAYSSVIFSRLAF
jgi:hypothetical protein